MTVTMYDIRQTIQAFGLAGQVVCIHSSLRSFGPIEGGAASLLDGFLAERCTVLVPAFSDARYAIVPPPDPAMRPARNAYKYDAPPKEDYRGANRIYKPTTRSIDLDMGVLPRTLVGRRERMRGNHPLASFAALGPLAKDVVAEQAPLAVYRPFEQLVKMQGWIILMGVGLRRMTFLHYAEQRAGRQLFLRWANGEAHQPILAEVGSCSEGFDHFEPMLAPLRRVVTVGQSVWQVFPARETLEAATQAIWANPSITHCGRNNCERCDDAVHGGPLLT